MSRKLWRGLCSWGDCTGVACHFLSLAGCLIQIAAAVFSGLVVVTGRSLAVFAIAPVVGGSLPRSHPAVYMPTHVTRLWLFLSRQGGGMSLTIDDLSQSSCYRRRTSHDAAPARSDHTRLGHVCTTLFGARLGPCASLTLGGDSHARAPHGNRGLAGHGFGDGAPLHQLPSGVESCHLVGPSWEPDPVGVSDHVLGPLGRNDRLRGGRHGGTPERPQDQRQRLLSGW